jgi:type IV pilus assembly protein PilC
MGEQIGSIDSALAKLADFYEEELDVMIDDLPFSLVPYFIVLYILVLGLILCYR